MTDNLFEPFRLNDTLTLNNRILMAPLTRCMADDDLVPTQLMADYYARRAQTGLIISEATNIRPDAQGYPNTPGLFTAKQIQGWRVVTDAIHQNDGKIFAQLWHTGRYAHSYYIGGQPVAPSAIALTGPISRMPELSYEVPKALTGQEIEQLVHDYKQAALNALEAGFDGVEIHGANGYLIDQFLHHDSNRRTDEFGVTPHNMARFPLAVVDGIIGAIGKDRTAIRVSPGSYMGVVGEPRDRDVFDYFLTELESREIAFIHLGIFDDSMTFDYLGGQASSYLRNAYSQTIVGVGSYTAQTASTAIEQDKFDLIAFGRPFIANPDFINRLHQGEPINEYDSDMLTQLY